MKKSKLNVWKYGIVGIFFVSLLFTACKNDAVSPKNEIEVLPDFEGYEFLVEPDRSLIPDVETIPEIDEATIERLKKVQNRAGCLTYNGPNYFPTTGLIYVFGPPVTWVWSYTYSDWIYLYNEDHPCGPFVYFRTNRPICGQSGLMADNNINNNVAWNWECRNGWDNSGSWRTFDRVNCTGAGWVDPLPQSTFLSSDFGCRALGDGFHAGIDFGGPVNGLWVKAVAGGRVIASRSSYGEVAIDHGTYITRYLHMTNRIGNGTLVSAGQNIGKVSGLDGNGANTYAPHLHFDYFADGIYPNNPDNQAQNPAVVICNISNLGISSVNTHNQGTLSLSQWCQTYGVTR